jgi:hypothetical protein
LDSIQAFDRQSDEINELALFAQFKMRQQPRVHRINLEARLKLIPIRRAGADLYVSVNVDVEQQAKAEHQREHRCATI